MRLLVFQHIACEHPGMLRRFLAEDGVAWDAVELDAGERIPPLENYDALWVMGGPMDVWEEDQYPWLAVEKRAIRRWVLELNRPYLGLCLGHQLLADALGGRCEPQPTPEIGIYDVSLTADGEKDPIFNGMEKRQKCLQWHSVRVAQTPDDATILASSDLCANQAMRIGRHAWSMQYHVEVEPDTVDNWGKVPAYKQALESSLGTDALDQLKSDADAQMSRFMESAAVLYRNFRATVSRVYEQTPGSQ